MVADTFSTDGVGVLLMGTGNDNNTWGSNANSSVFQVLADAVANPLANSVTGGTLDLSGSPPPAASSQARHSRLLFTGTLTADQTVIVPNLTKWWFVENATSGAFVLLFKTTAGTATQIPQGTMKIVRCDGSNGMRRLDSEDIGRIETFGNTLPVGKIACDGSAYKRARYPDLFAYLGTTWGLGTGGDVTTFGVPLLTDTGRFLRSSSGSLTVGTYQANQNLAHTHTGQATGTTDATNTDHTHTQQGTFVSTTESATHTHSGGFTSPSPVVAGSGIFGQTTNVSLQTGTQSVNHTHNITISGQTGSMSASTTHTHTFTSSVFTTSSSGGAEARPEAAVVLMCIRY